MAMQERYGICYLLKECGGSVYQWKRLKIGIYALSKGCIDDAVLGKIFNYKFKELCYAGPADSELEHDITSMIMTQYIGRERTKLPEHRTDHERIYLLERGRKTGETFGMGLSKLEKESVKDVSEKLKDERVSVDDLLNKYCQRWSSQAVKILEEAIIT